MSAPPGDGYGQYPQQPYSQPEQPEDHASQPAAHHHDGDHKKKKRGYAAQAFDFGTGANVTPGTGSAPAAAQYGMPQPQAPGYGGYPQQDPQVVSPGYPAQPYNAQQFGAPASGGAGGYQAPDAYYPGPGVPAPGAGAAAGIGNITAGMAQMQMGPGAQQAMPHAQQAVALNQLYPVDLLNQPFNPAELEFPPPPIILPPNVGSLLPL